MEKIEKAGLRMLLGLDGCPPRSLDETRLLTEAAHRFLQRHETTPYRVRRLLRYRMPRNIPEMRRHMAAYWGIEARYRFTE